MKSLLDYVAMRAAVGVHPSLVVAQLRRVLQPFFHEEGCKALSPYLGDLESSTPREHSGWPVWRHPDSRACK